MRKRMECILLAAALALGAASAAQASDLLFGDGMQADAGIEEGIQEIAEEEVNFLEAEEAGEEILVSPTSDPAKEQELTEEPQPVENGEDLLFSDGNETNEEIPRTVVSGTCGEDLRFTLTEDTLILEGFGPMDDTGVASRLEDPAVVKRVILPEGITTVGNMAFQGMSGLEEIVLPQSITSIGINAFMDCSALNSIEFPRNLETIETGAFARCSSLREIVLPESVSSMGMFCFYSCSGLEKAVLSSSLRVIPYLAFGECYALKEAVLPEGIRGVGEEAFFNCYNLEEITFPQSLQQIERQAFYGCESLRQVQIPDRVTALNLGAFEYCTNLVAVKLPESLVCVDYLTFAYCSSLKRIEIPAGVKRIYGSAFDSCFSLEEAVLPPNLVSLDDKVFKGCEKLTSITVGPYVEEIGGDTFSGCGSLTIYGYEGSYVQAYAVGFSIPFEPLPKADQTVTARAAYSRTLGEGAFVLEAASDGNGTLSFINNSPEIVTVKRSGKVIPLRAGLAKVWVYAEEDVVTKPSETVEISIRILPDQVMIRNLKSAQKGKMTLKWTAAEGVDGYQIRYRKGSGAYVKLKITDPERVSKTFSNLSPGKLYTVSIRSYAKSEGETVFGAWSEEVQIRTAK